MWATLCCNQVDSESLVDLCNTHSQGEVGDRGDMGEMGNNGTTGPDGENVSPCHYHTVYDMTLYLLMIRCHNP